MSTLASLPDTVFRANVGAVIINDKGQVLAFERADNSDAWQFPQGGLESGEEPDDAIHREVLEETGIKSESLVLLQKHPEWLAYEIPPGNRKGARGQVQKWFLFKLIGSTDEIDLENAIETEFKSWKWTTMTELIEIAFFFRRPIYRKLQAEFGTFLLG